MQHITIIQKRNEGFQISQLITLKLIKKLDKAQTIENPAQIK